jgi:hypothetical protein
VEDLSWSFWGEGAFGALSSRLNRTHPTLLEGWKKLTLIEQQVDQSQCSVRRIRLQDLSLLER